MRKAHVCRARTLFCARGRVAMCTAWLGIFLRAASRRAMLCIMAPCVCAYANYESTCAIGSTRCNQVRLNELVYIGTIARFGVSQRGLRCVGMFSVCATFACSSTRRVDCRIVAQALAPRFRCPLSCGSTFRFGYMS